MNVRTDIPMPKKARGRPRRYDFTKVKPGDSMHAIDHVHSQSIRGSFLHYCRTRDLAMTTTRLKVGANDPDGPGYRVWFIEIPSKKDAA